MVVSIIALYFLTKQLGKIAESKGEIPSRWKMQAILAWLIGDMIGEMLVFQFFGLNVFLLFLFGVGLGYVGYLIVKQRLESLPDVD
ncbi:MAG TPA: hypothetical protein VF691_02070 [Cytophagaceae bacterium]|jgi:hypothetical protein